MHLRMMELWRVQELSLTHLVRVNALTKVLFLVFTKQLYADENSAANSILMYPTESPRVFRRLISVSQAATA